MIAPGRPDNGHDEGRELPSVATSQAQCDVAEVLHEDGTLVWGVALVKAQQILDRRHPAVAADQRRDPEQVAQLFHETYERLAPSFGYETRRASAVPWEQVPERNRALMTAVCAELLSLLGQAGSDTDGGER